MSDKNDLLALAAALAPEEFIEIALQLRSERDALRDALEQIAGTEYSDPEIPRRIAIDVLADLANTS